jgi:hypothetical protein
VRSDQRPGGCETEVECTVTPESQYSMELWNYGATRVSQGLANMGVAQWAGESNQRSGRWGMAV